MLATELLEEAADACGVELKHIRAGRRFKACVRAKRATIYAMRKWTEKPHSLAHLGRIFGTDHASIKYNLERAEDQRERDEEFRQLTDILVEHAQVTVQLGRLGRRSPRKPIVQTKRDPTPDEQSRVWRVVKLASELFSADFEAIAKGERRFGPEFEATAAAVWAIRESAASPLGFTKLGWILERNHTSIVHAKKRADELRREDAAFQKITNLLFIEAQRSAS